MKFSTLEDFTQIGIPSDGLKTISLSSSHITSSDTWPLTSTSIDAKAAKNIKKLKERKYFTEFSSYHIYYVL